MISLGAVLLVVSLIILEGLFSGGEIALVSCDVNKIKLRAESGDRSAETALKLLANPDKFLATTLTGTNLCVVANTVFATSLFINYLGTARGEMVSIAVMIPLLLLMGEIVPKSIFQQHAEEIVLRLSWFILAASWVFLPFVYIVSKISRSAVYIFTKRKGLLYSPHITKSGLEFLLKDEEMNGDIMQSEREMIQNIFELPNSTAEEVMVPLSNMTALSEEISIEEAAKVFDMTGFSRIPVYDKKIFNITGIVHSFDLLEALCSFEAKGSTGPLRTLRDVARRDILYVPETKRTSELLFEMQKRSQLMAIIVDEYGGATGIVTVEDILEEIVGEIDDEYHNGRKKPFKEIGTNKYIFSAQTKLDSLSKIIPITIPEGDYETLGGFLLQRMGRIPKKREAYRENDVLYVIDEADMKSIKEVLIVLPKSEIKQEA